MFIRWPDDDEVSATERNEAGLGDQLYQARCNGGINSVATCLGNVGARVGGDLRA